MNKFSRVAIIGILSLVVIMTAGCSNEQTEVVVEDVTQEETGQVIVFDSVGENTEAEVSEEVAIEIEETNNKSEETRGTETPKKEEGRPHEETVVEAPVVVTPVAEEPVVETPVVVAPVVEEPVIETPVIEETVVEEPVIEETVVEETISEEVPEGARATDGSKDRTGGRRESSESTDSD